MLQKSSNPAFAKINFASYAKTGEGIMTINGVINKSLLLLLIIIVGASITWNMVFQGNASVTGLMIGGLIMGFVFALATIFKKEWAHITAPLYAIAQGLFLGAVSAFIESSFLTTETGAATAQSGIVMKAVALTFAVFLLMFLLYRNRIIKPTKKFMLGVTAATGAIALMYLLNIVMGFFGSGLSFLHSSGPFGIIISLVIVAVAALNLILDFKFIEDGVNQGAPKQMEWYFSFGLMVTLVWLYIEILRLLALLSGRD
ncbi:MAG: Bax inhibitor-1/YccA family membrane protein [Bacteroidota bacterium]